MGLFNLFNNNTALEQELDEAKEKIQLVLGAGELRRSVLVDQSLNIDTIKKSILAKAFRGELGTNNPNEDSAINLLKEVLQDKF